MKDFIEILCGSLGVAFAFLTVLYCMLMPVQPIDNMSFMEKEHLVESHNLKKLKEKRK